MKTEKKQRKWLRNPLTFFNNLKLGKKMLVAFVIGILFPVLVLQVVSYAYNNQYMTKKINELTLMNLTQMAERVNLTLDGYTNLLYQIYIDESIAQSINIVLEENESGKAAAYNDILNRLKQYNISEKGIRCISVVCADGSTISYDYKTGSFIENLWTKVPDMRQSTPYLNAEGQSGMVLTPTEVFPEEDGDTYVFHISKRIFDLEDLEKGSIATVIMSIEASVLQEICASQYDEVTGEEYAIAFILGQNREVITYPQDMFMGISVDEKLEIPGFIKVSNQLKDKTIAVNEYVDSRTKWSFYYVYDKEYLLRDITNIQRNLIVIGTIAVLMSAVLISYIMKRILSSISELLRGMDEVKEGNFDIVLQNGSSDEIGQIADNFNEMTGEINQLIEKVKQATDSQKNAEIKALEAQINPHFLYNTLDSINWMAIEKGEYEISNMLRSLGVILRYSVSNSNKKVSIEEVGNWLEKYISLQQMRFNNSFSYSIHIQEEVKKVQMYKLLLQPFVENAIIHGFDGIEHGGTLQVDIIETENEKDKVCIIIEDNGNGMTAEQVAHFNNREDVIWDGSGIGLHNAFSRMQMYYGDLAEWKITSIVSAGTVVTLKIPKENSMTE